MAEDLPFASASDVTERGGGFSSVRGNAFRDDGRNESAVVQVHTAVFRLPVYTDSIQHIHTSKHTGSYNRDSSWGRWRRLSCRIAVSVLESESL